MPAGGGALIVLFIIYGSCIFCVYLGALTGPVNLVIYSGTDRPILGFSVNSIAGEIPVHIILIINLRVKLEGQRPGCWSIKGKIAEIIWTLSVTGPQYEAEMRPEQRRVVMPMPGRKS